MILGDIADMIGDRASHIQFGVVDQAVEQRDHRGRIALEAAQAAGPGQARTGTLADQAADVRIGVGDPRAEALQGPGRIGFDVGPDRELSGEPPGQGVAGLHGGLPVGQQVAFDAGRMREIEEGLEAVARGRAQGRAETGDQATRCLDRGCRQMPCHHRGEVLGSRHQLQRVQAANPFADETLLVESRHLRRQAFRQQPHQLAVEQRLERRAALDRRWCREAFDGMHGRTLRPSPDPINRPLATVGRPVR